MSEEKTYDLREYLPSFDSIKVGAGRVRHRKGLKASPEDRDKFRHIPSEEEKETRRRTVCKGKFFTLLDAIGTKEMLLELDEIQRRYKVIDKRSEHG